MGYRARSDETAHHFCDFIEFLLAFLGIAARGGLSKAVVDVVFENALLYFFDRGPYRAGLREDVDTIAFVLDHADDAGELAVDPP